MIERLLLDRIDILGNGAAVHKRIQDTLAILTNPTASPMAVSDHAMKAAQVTVNFIVTERFPEFCFVEIHRGIIADYETGRMRAKT
jgi:hypothetical protein